ncbi:MAG: type II toxin-antitoxin system ParD family antitoxin [Salinisphaera sp.]|nr:type II toxin-antitoxin system ParD family antitoxin [Salinisphaera sp.]
MIISFTEKQADYIAKQVTSGDFQNASEVVRDALRLHQVYRQRIIEDLRAEIAKGWDGAASPRSVRDIIETKSTDRG